MNDNLLANIAKEYGTPSYVFDLDALVQRVNRIREIVPKTVDLCFSIKANPFLLSTLSTLVDKYEVCSPGELQICEKCNIDMKRVILSGVYKSSDDVVRAFADGVSIFTAESLQQAELVNAHAKSHRKKVTLLPRLTNGSQFGMSREDLFTLFSERNAYEYVDISGIHFFSGTQKKQSSQIIAELEMVANLCADIDERFSIEIKSIEYGPGFGVPYFINENDDMDATLLDETIPALAKMAERWKVTIEMGRYLTAFCGHYLTRVVDSKHHTNSSYAIIDGGIHHLVYAGHNMGMRVPYIRRVEAGVNGVKKDWTICGSLCTMGDVLVRKVSLLLDIGDVLAFERVGAYSVTEGIALFLSRDLPRIILYENGKTRMARDIMHTANLNCSER